MHARIRQRQGLPYSKEVPQGMAANLRLMQTHEHRLLSRPDDENALRLAYGAGMASKLVAELGNDALATKALRQALHAMADPQLLSSLLAAGLIPALNTSVQNEDEGLRSLAVQGLSHAARHPLGLREMVAHASVDVLVVEPATLADASEEVRRHGLGAVIELARQPASDVQFRFRE